MPLCSDPLLFWASLIAAAALGCGSGGQSFDDGSGDLGRGRRSPVDAAPHVTLAEQPSTAIRASFLPGGQYFDSSSGFVGDLDGDGYADFALLAWAATGADWDANQQTAYVFYGRQQFPAELEPDDADFVITGVQGQLTSIGDFNGDGFDDFGFLGEGWIGTPGRFDVLLGGAVRRSGTLSARTLETSIGPGPLESLNIAAGPGDVNGDGYADLLLDSDLILGRAEPYGQTTGIAIARIDAGTARAARAGDLDGDGYADLLLDDPYAEQTRLFYGRADWGSGLEPLAADAIFPGRVRSLGDWDGDGHVDLVRLQNVPTWSDPEQDELLALRHDLDLIHGGVDRFVGSIALSPQAPDQLWKADELALGDVNGDSRPDLILAAPLSPWQQHKGAGAVFLVANLSDRVNELRLEERDAALQGQADGNIGDLLGSGVSSGADANGDGYADLLVVQQSWRDSLGAQLIFGGQGL
jgi:hypothetical protein